MFVSSCSLLIRGYHPRRCQAENPLITLCRFPRPALIVENVKTSDTGPYSIYSSSVENETSEPLDEKRSIILEKLRKVDSITLELAATADYLSASGFAADAWNETAKRKASKAKPDRIAKAKALLAELEQFR